MSVTLPPKCRQVSACASSWRMVTRETVANTKNKPSKFTIRPSPNTSSCRLVIAIMIAVTMVAATNVTNPLLKHLFRLRVEPVQKALGVRKREFQ